MKHTILENSALYIVEYKPWYAQKIAVVLGEIIVPEYLQVPAIIPATNPSYQVNAVLEHYVM